MSKYTHIAIISTMRTGSNLLERILVQHPDLVLESELFNNNFIGSRNQDTHLGFDIAGRDNDPNQFLEAVATANTGFVPIFRYFHDHSPAPFDAIMQDAKIAKIILRRNPLDSYISLKAAQMTDQWLMGRRATQTDSPKIIFDEIEYQDWLDAVTQFYERVESAVNTDACFHLNYGDITNLTVLNEITVKFQLSQEFGYFFEPVKKQLGQSSIDHVSNRDALAAISTHNFPPPRDDHTPHQRALSEIWVAENLNLAFIPIYGTNERIELALLERENDAPLRQLSTKDIDVLDGLHIYTRVIQPELRAAEIFARELFEETGMISTNMPDFIGDDEFVADKMRYPDRPRVLQRKYGFDAVHYRTGLRKFVIALRKELWGGKRRYVASDLFWPQAMLIKNLSLGARLEVLVGDKFPNHDHFAPLAEIETSRNYAQRPYPDKAFLGKMDNQIFDLYREDFEAYFDRG